MGPGRAQPEKGTCRPNTCRRRHRGRVHCESDGGQQRRSWRTDPLLPKNESSKKIFLVRLLDCLLTSFCGENSADLSSQYYHLPIHPLSLLELVGLKPSYHRTGGRVQVYSLFQANTGRHTTICTHIHTCS